MDDFERWEKIAEWRGHTVATLESMNEELKEIKEIQKSIQEQLTNTKIKVATMSGTVALIVTIVTMLVGNYI